MDEKYLRELVEERKMSYTQISNLTGIPKPTIAWNIKKFGINPAQKYYPLNKNELIKLYIEQGLSTEKIANQLGVWQKSVLFWLNRYDIPTRPKGTNQFKEITYDIVKEEFKKQGHKLLSYQYKKSTEKLNYVCRCGNKSSMSYIVCKRGTGCKKCAIENRRKHEIGLKKHLLDYKRNPEYYKEWSKQQREKYPEKNLARDVLGKAVKSGKIKKPNFCSKCNLEAKRIEGHHEDYAKPLEVIWLCTSCHRNLHRCKAALQRS